MPFSGKQIPAVIIKYISGEELTEGESVSLNEFLGSEDNRKLFNYLTNKNGLEKEAKNLGEVKKEIWNKINENIWNYKVISIRSRSVRAKIIAVAAILLLVAGSIYFWTDHSSSKAAVANNNNTVNLLTPEDIHPATNKTLLTLANGQTVIIDPSSSQGTLATEKGGSVVKLQDGQLVYQRANDQSKNLYNIYNTVTTSRGGKQRIVLSEGTEVWLNASSSIKYPVAFTGTERKVVITGEAYFEVSPFRGPGGGKIPFIVDVAGKGEVEVLGTHFNINSYDDEESIKVTLLEGKVKVTPVVNSQLISNNAQLLSPGQQAVLNGNNKLKIVDYVDVDYVMAWKNGLFMFKSADIETILREAARWYDINIVYKEKSADRFSGKIDRKVNLAQLLQILKENEVTFKFEEGRKLIITEK